MNEKKQSKTEGYKQTISVSIAGSLAAALLDKMVSADWIRKVKNSRVMIVTARGQKEFYAHLN